MTLYCYLNGKIMPVKKAAIGVRDLGILRGYGVFDFMRTYGGRPFLVQEHLARFRRSAAILNLPVPLPQSKIAILVERLLKKSRTKEAAIRMVLTGGATRDGMTPGRPTLLILIERLKKFPKAYYTRGATLITHEYERDFPRAKTTNYMAAVAMRDRRKKKGAAEILYVSRGKILEASTSNFFVFKGSTLVTPQNNILLGTRRNLVIKLAQPYFRIEERDLFLKELPKSTEAFITATNKEIVPIVKIDGRRIGDGKVGQHTTFLMRLFREYTRPLTK